MSSEDVEVSSEDVEVSSEDVEVSSEDVEVSSEDVEVSSENNEKMVSKAIFNKLIIITIITIGVAAFFAGSYISNLNSDQISEKELNDAIAKLELKFFKINYLQNNKVHH